MGQWSACPNMTPTTAACNVGIGFTTAPGAKLHVLGSTILNGGTTLTGATTNNGLFSVTGGQTTLNSGLKTAGTVNFTGLPLGNTLTRFLVTDINGIVSYRDFSTIGDNLGNHNATQNLAMNCFGIDKTKYLTFCHGPSITALGTGLMITTPSLNVSSIAPNSFVGTNAAGNLVAVPAPGADNLGNHTATQNLNMNCLSILKPKDIIFCNSAYIKPGPTAGGSGLELGPTVRITNIPPNSCVGTDALGNLVASTNCGNDNLGNHTATQDLNMKCNRIFQVKGIDFCNTTHLDEPMNDLLEARNNFSVGNNTLSSGTYNTMNGKANIINGGGSYFNLVSGTSNTINEPSESNFVTGDANSVNVSSYNTTNGNNNYVSSSKNNTTTGSSNSITESNDNLTNGYAHGINNSTYNLTNGDKNTLITSNDNLTNGYANTLEESNYNIVSGASNGVTISNFNNVSGNANIVKNNLNSFVSGLGNQSYDNSAIGIIGESSVVTNSVESVVLGEDNHLNGGHGSAVIGGHNIVDGQKYTIAIGRQNTTKGYSDITLGDLNFVDGGTNMAIGHYTSSPAGHDRIAIGHGCATIPMTNTCDNSLFVGFDSDLPTLAVTSASGKGTYGEVHVAYNSCDPTGYPLFVNGDAYATGNWISSDKRFKKDIQSIGNALEIVKGLDGKTYDFRTEEFKDRNFSKGRNYGFLAQDLLKVMPEAVKQSTDGFYAVNYQAIIPVLSEAIKSQQAIIEKLESRISSLENNGTNLAKNNINLTTDKAELFQNAPNPFSDRTIIKYIIPNTIQNAVMYVYDMNGRQLKSYKIDTKGEGSIAIDGGELSEGMYLYSLITDGKEVSTKRMILTKN